MLAVLLVVLFHGLIAGKFLAAAGVGASGITYNLVEIVVGIFAIAGLAGGAFAVMRTNLTKQTIEQLQDNNTALHDRITILEAEGHSKDATIEENRNTIADLREQLRLLADQVTGASAVAALAKIVDKHHNEIMSVLGTVIDKEIGHITEGGM